MLRSSATSSPMWRRSAATAPAVATHVLPQSYLSNAKAHLGASGLIKVDVRKFFQSVKRVAVADFFQRHMLCAPDVAGMLAKLLTIDAHLPTGSAVSPILSYYAHKDMFDEIEALAIKHGLIMTCYVDDMCLSGDGARPWVLFHVRAVIARHGLRSHKAHYFAPARPRIVTGVVIHRGQALLPDRRHKKINEEHELYRAATVAAEKLALGRRLLSRVNEAAQIDPVTWKPRARILLSECRQLEIQARAPLPAVETV